MLIQSKLETYNFYLISKKQIFRSKVGYFGVIICNNYVNLIIWYFYMYEIRCRISYIVYSTKWRKVPILAQVAHLKDLLKKFLYKKNGFCFGLSHLIILKVFIHVEIEMLGLNKIPFVGISTKSHQFLLIESGIVRHVHIEERDNGYGPYIVGVICAWTTTNN